MKDFRNLVLCDYRSKSVDVHVRANLTDGTLQISGHDLGPCVEESWGDEDYEYWYSFDKANTEKLIAAIHGEEDPEAALIREFSGEEGCSRLSGEEGCSRLESFCSEKKIKYRFSSYV